MCADQQRGLPVSGRPSRRPFDTENIEVGLPQGPKRLPARRQAGFSEPCREILCSLAQCVRGALGMAFSNQRLEMAKKAVPSVGQGDVVPLRGDFRANAFARKYFKENGMRHAAIDDVRLADALFQGIQAGMDLG